MQTHPAANIWPLMSEAELQALAEDMKLNGQHMPIIRVGGLILDGRNRYLGCQRAGIEPWYADVETDDPHALAWSLNQHRRHAEEGMRAMAAAKRANLQRGDNQWMQRHEGGTSQAEAALLYDVTTRAIQRAKSVLAHNNPVIIEAVSTGKCRLTSAAQVVKRINAGDARPITAFAELRGEIRQIWHERLTARRKDPLHIFKVLTTFVDKNPVDNLLSETNDWAKDTILGQIQPICDYFDELHIALKNETERPSRH